MNARSYPRRARALAALAVFALLASPTSAEAQVCGNDALEAPEACDDGALVSMDGCSSTCTIEPGWACACAAPTFSYSGEVLAGRLGGDGGGEGPQMGCTGNDVLIGMGVDWSNSLGDAVRTRAICGSFSVDATGAVTTTQTTTQTSGGLGCGGWDPSTASPDVTCPSGFGVVGLTGLASDLGGTTTLFQDASIVCQALGVDGRTAGPTMTLNVTGGGGVGTPQTVDCPPGTIARFFRTRAGCAQDALDLFCATPVVSCDGGSSICGTLCGDGFVGAPDETCDDGNTDAGDGCDASCAIETGWDCSSAGMPCTAVCGDGMTLGAEDCDTSGASATCDADCTTAECGDSVLNTLASEVCDDGNTDTGDGCDASCDPESGWGCACGAPTFSYSGEELAGRLGGDGGSVGSQMGCTGNDVLIGLALNWSDTRGEAVRTRIICGSFSVDVGGAITTTQTTTEENGGSGCFGWDPSTWSPEVTCPSGFGLVGLTGEHDGGTLFKDASIVCQAMGVDGRTAGPTVTLNIPGGAGGTTPQTVDCPPGTLARFFQTRAGCGQDALDLFCATPAVSCDDELSICDTLCGDGVVGAPVEACDDGNTDAGDGCDATCNLETGWDCSTGGVACTAICGDGMTLGAEDCDTSGVSMTCDADCTLPMCGDTTVNMSFGEDCDDGMETAACDGDCTVVMCGDGRLNLLASEVCDWGPDNSDTDVDACRTTCFEPGCGDSIVDSGETCDLGAANSDDAGSDCGTSCGPLSCGDGVIEGVEQCDEGGANSDSDADACRTSCALARCGDSIVDSVETCDDGFANSDVAGSTCSTSCGVATCGDGVMDSGEGCDDGSSNSDTEVDACRVSCAVAQCGDGVIDTGETCDEGRSNSDLEPDQCRRTCEPASCGDGVVDAGEGCDEGDANSDDAGATCRTNCALGSCGDGVVDAGEECDDGDGNADTADACRTTCVNPSCGDDIVDAAEGCDDGGDNSDTQTDACRTDCSPAACGDGVTDMAETCDDGDDNSDTTGDSCRTDCSAASCGDGVVDTGEGCDDGGASATCSVSCETVEMDAGMPDGAVDAGTDGGGDAGFGLSGGACSVQQGTKSSRGALLLMLAASLVLWRRRRA